ncbi:MAG: hypothetical protein HC925_03930 [Coleofasciculaceae cyanobacterium SM2_3_26]|nr:hypothetical protein [Coleofasciculaceae cyanobacterium SM2_3_26]
MAESQKLPRAATHNGAAWRSEASLGSVPVAIASPERNPNVCEIPCMSPGSHWLIRLDLEPLTCFEVVDRQFERWGMTFANAIAIQPSNPAFAPQTGSTVLMGAPKGGFLEIQFHRPACLVSAKVTSFRRPTLTAYDRSGACITQIEGNIPSDGDRPTGAETCPQSPKLLLSANIPNIHRITLHAFGGQLTVDELTVRF